MTPPRSRQRTKDPVTPNQLQPGDIWRHPLGNLYVTDEDFDLHPGYLKCYWSMGGNPNAPWSFLDPKRTGGMKLIKRMGEQTPDGEWHLKR